MISGHIEESEAPIQVTCDEDSRSADVSMHQAALAQKGKSLGYLSKTQRKVNATLLP